MQPFSLKTKVTLLFPMVITVLFACLLLLMYSFLQKYSKETVSDRQYQIVSVLADNIDRNVAHNVEVMVSVAEKITPEMVNDPKKALLYLKQQSEHLLVFDNGLFVFTPEGRIQAELPLELERTGTDFSFREYFRQTIATRKPIVSDPYESSQKHRHPAIMFTAPIFSGSGALIGVLGGSADLSNSAFAGRLKNVKMGNSGYTFLFNEDRLMVLHPDTTRIMKHDIPSGSNKLLDRALTGFDGSGETVNSRGLDTLSTFKHLKTKNWILGANYPLVEAYAPVTKIRNAFLIVLPIFQWGCSGLCGAISAKWRTRFSCLPVMWKNCRQGAVRHACSRAMGGMRLQHWERPLTSSCV